MGRKGGGVRGGEKRGGEKRGGEGERRGEKGREGKEWEGIVPPEFLPGLRPWASDYRIALESILVLLLYRVGYIFCLHEILKVQLLKVNVKVTKTTQDQNCS